jgi:hypothetical protein
MVWSLDVFFLSMYMFTENTIYINILRNFLLARTKIRLDDWINSYLTLWKLGGVV